MHAFFLFIGLMCLFEQQWSWQLLSCQPPPPVFPPSPVSLKRGSNADPFRPITAKLLATQNSHKELTVCGLHVSVSLRSLKLSHCSFTFCVCVYVRARAYALASLVRGRRDAGGIDGEKQRKRERESGKDTEESGWYIERL